MELQKASARFTEITHEIKALTTTLRGEVDASRSHFTGQAATAYQGVMSRYDGDAASLNQALEAIAEAIAQSATTFHATDAETHSDLTRAGGQLGNLNLR